MDELRNTAVTNPARAAGYRHYDYASSLKEFGEIIEMPLSGAWMLKRKIADTDFYDAIGCYPLFSCHDWKSVARDLRASGSNIVSFSAVVDPLGDYQDSDLEHCFNHTVRQFKAHYLVDLSAPLAQQLSRHHRRYIGVALKKLSVEVVDQPSDHLCEWNDLYRELVQRHDIKGISAFSDKAFALQLKVPGVRMFRARYEGNTVASSLWYVDGDVGYYHLSAANETGYRMRASYGLMWSALEYFEGQKLKLLNLGGGAGLKVDSDDGLARYKSGWSTHVKPAYFVGHVFDSAAYDALSADARASDQQYFPAYRFRDHVS